MSGAPWLARLTGGELAALARKLDRAVAACYRVADRSTTGWRMRQLSRTAAEMAALRSDVVDEAIRLHAGQRPCCGHGRVPSGRACSRPGEEETVSGPADGSGQIPGDRRGLL